MPTVNGDRILKKVHGDGAGHVLLHLADILLACQTSPRDGSLVVCWGRWLQEGEKNRKLKSKILSNRRQREEMIKRVGIKSLLEKNKT